MWNWRYTVPGIFTCFLADKWESIWEGSGKQGWKNFPVNYCGWIKLIGLAERLVHGVVFVFVNGKQYSENGSPLLTRVIILQQKVPV